MCANCHPRRPSGPASLLPVKNSLNPKLKSNIEAKDKNISQILNKDNQDSQNLMILNNEYLFLR